MDKAQVHISEAKGTTTVILSGDWTKDSVASRAKQFEILTCKNKTTCIFDFTAINDFDTHGIMLILHHIKRIEALGCSISNLGQNDHFAKLFAIVETHFPQEIIKPAPTFLLFDYFENIGKMILEGQKTLFSFFSFTGELFHFILKAFSNPLTIRVKATLYHIENSGAGAIPIIFLTSFLIGIVIAYQGATQLEKFGANIFIVEMVTISAVRELAPLLTAIVVAGRSASAYTAQIGVMKITDEVDAMRSMGFSPWDFLVLPRLFALLISLPLLVFFADVVSTFGGMVIASTKLGVSFPEFIDRVQETVALKHFVIGLVKAPIFGAIIATIGCFRGFQIDSSTESVGKYTTISVVNAIFWVIAMDALISVLLTEMGL